MRPELRNSIYTGGLSALVVSLVHISQSNPVEGNGILVIGWCFLSLLLGMLAGFIVGRIFIKAGIGDNGILSGVISGGAVYILQILVLINFLISNPVVFP